MDRQKRGTQIDCCEINFCLYHHVIILTRFGEWESCSSVESFAQCSRLREQILSVDAQAIFSNIAIFLVLCFLCLHPRRSTWAFLMCSTALVKPIRFLNGDLIEMTPRNSLDSVPCDLVKHQGKWNENMLASHQNWELSKSAGTYLHFNRKPIDFSIKFKIWSDLSCQVCGQDATKTYSIDAMWRFGSWYTPAEWFTSGRWSLDFHRGGRWWSHLWWDVDFWDRKLHRIWSGNFTGSSGFIHVNYLNKKTQGFGWFI